MLMFYVCSYILTLCTARVWGNIFAFGCVKLANAWRGERQTPQSKPHPSCLSVSCVWGRPAAMLPAISTSLTSSLPHCFFKRNDLLIFHRNCNKSSPSNKSPFCPPTSGNHVVCTVLFKLQTTRRSLPYNKCMGSCGFQPRPQLSYMEILERFHGG